MRWTQTLIPTQKETPADAQIISHQLMIRAGLIRQLQSGVYDFLPLGLRALQKATRIVREEMDAIGCAEVLMPALHPLELWQRTGRDKLYGPNLFRLKDRHGRESVLAPTHEECSIEMVQAYVSSHRQLPLRIYQIQTKFRDEFRPRFGLLRVREFLMKDAYSFDAIPESLDKTYQEFYQAYERIFRRCGIPFVVVEAESGPIGGSASHEFMAPCSAGEDTILTSDKGNYAANVEKCETGARKSDLTGPPVGELEKVHTPGLPGIDGVAEFLKTRPRHMLKTLVFSTSWAQAGPGDGGNLSRPAYVVAVVRGDHEVNEAKLKQHALRHFKVPSLSMEDSPELRRNWAIGFVGPDEAIRRSDTVMIIDPDAAQGGFWVTGANEIDYHVKYFNWFRECGPQLADPNKVAIADIRNAIDGDPSPRNDGGILKASKGIEIGHVFKLGTVWSVPMEAGFLDEKGEKRPFIMGCYGIGIGRILIAAVENLNDERGIIWPAAIAPYSCVITPIRYEGPVKDAADRLYQQLNAAGIDTLLDDRDARPGFKFADADLIGFPVRINVGDRGLKDGKVEIKKRTDPEATLVPLDAVIEAVRQMLRQQEQAA